MNIKKLNVILILSVISVSLHGSEAIKAMNKSQDAEEVSPPASPTPPASPVMRAVEHEGQLYPDTDGAEPSYFLDPMVQHTGQREFIKALQPVTNTAGTVWAYTPNRAAVAQGAFDVTYGVRRLVLDGVVVAWDSLPPTERVLSGTESVVQVVSDAGSYVYGSTRGATHKRRHDTSFGVLDELAPVTREDKSAIKIQALFRGHRARKALEDAKAK